MALAVEKLIFSVQSLIPFYSLNPEYRHGLWDFLWKIFNPAKHTPYPQGGQSITGVRENK